MTVQTFWTTCEWSIFDLTRQTAAIVSSRDTCTNTRCSLIHEAAVASRELRPGVLLITTNSPIIIVSLHRTRFYCPKYSRPPLVRQRNDSIGWADQSSQCEWVYTIATGQSTKWFNWMSWPIILLRLKIQKFIYSLFVARNFELTAIQVIV